MDVNPDLKKPRQLENVFIEVAKERKLPIYAHTSGKVPLRDNIGSNLGVQTFCMVEAGGYRVNAWYTHSNPMLDEDFRVSISHNNLWDKHQQKTIRDVLREIDKDVIVREHGLVELHLPPKIDKVRSGIRRYFEVDEGVDKAKADYLVKLGKLEKRLRS